MFQAVISPEHRGGLGAHYTSVPNIMKVIEPLFLNELKESFEDATGNEKKLKELLHRISKIKFFDPACGSGNFLIIAYKELRRLEMLILKDLGGFAFTGIHLKNFYGIELDDFAHEIAKLSLWLAEHQMNVEFFNEFGRTNPTLPLQEAGHIVCGNACRLDWEKVCPKNEGDEIYIMGNPPYMGSKRQSLEQKSDMAFVFKDIKGYKNLDYIACWFFKGAEFISDFNSSLAFVSTNSIVQGDQVALLWPNIFNYAADIHFAHTSFKWGNNAKGNAGVSCVIVGLSGFKVVNKLIFSQNLLLKVNSISPYLTPNSNIIVCKRTKTISHIPTMSYGNMPLEGGFLRLTEEEKNSIVDNFPKSIKFVRKVVGGDEFLKGINRFCLWIEDSELQEAKSIRGINERIELVRNFRINGGDVARTLVDKSHQFRYRSTASKSFILIPCTSSEKRIYLPCGFFNSSFISMNSAQVIYDSEPYIFSILSSKMHMLWSKATAGCLESRLRYSAMLCYNTFPISTLITPRREELTQSTFRILEEREKHSDKTIAELYDPDKMPEGLKEAHRLNDEAVERCYRSTPFSSDEERLEYLFKLYEKMIQEEKEKGTLFEAEKKTRKKK